MKLKHGLIAIACVVLLTGPAIAEECKDCPRDNPCGYIKPASDGCNTCAGVTWCINNQWYSEGVVLCTSLHCTAPKKIRNPFIKDTDQSKKGLK
jgi:hypothetical protein